MSSQPEPSEDSENLLLIPHRFNFGHFRYRVRVADAISRLVAGEDRESIRRRHGSIVLEAAETMRSPTPVKIT